MKKLLVASALLGSLFIALPANAANIKGVDLNSVASMTSYLKKNYLKPRSTLKQGPYDDAAIFHIIHRGNKIEMKNLIFRLKSYNK